MSSKSSLAFNILGFSTNSDTFTPLKIIEKFISNSEYSDEKTKKENSLHFYYKLENDQYKPKKLLITITQILNCEQGHFDFLSFADLYLIIFDLEREDAYEKLDIIITFIKNFCDSQKTIYILGIYTDGNNTKNNLCQEDIIEYLDEKKLIYEYVESNYESMDLIKTIDFIIKEGIKYLEKKSIELEGHSRNDSASKSKCFIY